MKKQTHDKHPYLFTVGLVNEKHLQVLASDERTRLWALSKQARVSMCSRAIADELRAKKLEMREREPWEPPAPRGVMTVELVREMFARLLRTEFPRQTFLVTAPDTPKMIDAIERATSTGVGHGQLAMLAGYAPVEIERRA